jgi:hypothetical protein
LELHPRLAFLRSPVAGLFPAVSICEENCVATAAIPLLVYAFPLCFGTPSVRPAPIIFTVHRAKGAPIPQDALRTHLSLHR